MRFYVISTRILQRSSVLCTYILYSFCTVVVDNLIQHHLSVT